ncbi:MAG: ATP-dependent zinc metalloprotease FtsH [Bdellovibrionota bacterium]
MRQTQKTMALWAILLVVLIVLFQMYATQSRTAINREKFRYPEYQQALKDGKIQSVTIRAAGPETGSSEIVGELKPAYKDEFGGMNFAIVGPPAAIAHVEASKAGVKLDYERNDSNGLLQTLLVNWLPLILIVAMFMFIMRQIQVGGGKAMNFGKSKARLLTENKNKVTFNDVAGVEEAKDDLVEIVHFLKDPKKFTKLGGRIPKGVLLVGSPGTGKTLLARAVAGEAGVPFFTISGSDFVEMFVGVGASRVRDLFEQGKRNAPCLIFIDEIDAVGRHRGAGMGGGHDEREQTLNQLLVEMDGFESNDGVILIAATNRPDVLDPALLRPGRFDRRVVVNKPDLNGRLKILNVHVKKTPLATNVDLEKVARGTPGFAGADLENLVNEAALNAARTNKAKLTQDDFEHAKDKVMMGAERRSMVISEEDKRITAYHEAGHTLVGKMIPGTDPIHKVTIIPRGMALGVTQTLPEKEALNLTKIKAENMIAFLFGGRAAEAIVFHDYTTGAGNDIERATDIARRMVCEWGMSEKLGPLAWEKREGPVFLGMQSSGAKSYSEAKAEEIDAEVFRLVTEGYERAKRLLTENMDTLHRLSSALLEHETIDGNEVEMIVKGGTLDDLRRDRSARERDMAKEQAQGRAASEEEFKKGSTDDGGPIGNPAPAT